MSKGRNKAKEIMGGKIMKKRKRVISILVAIMLLGNCCIPTNAQVKERTKGKNYIVLLNKSGDVKKLKSNYDIEQKEHSSVLEKQNMACAILNDKEKTALESDENVLCIEEDANIRALSIKSKKELKKAINKKVKPSYSWNVEIINADDKINNSIENRVKVAVIDSGMDATEAFDVKRHINFVDEENSVAPIYEDRTGHGTSIAGIIAGNGNGLKGINPNAELYSLKVLDENNQSTISRVVEAIYWCIDNDINIINMSFGTTVNSEILHNAIMEAYDRGILMIAAAGNSGTAIHYPAAYAEVMAVGSINSNNKISEYSCESKDIEILAPGEKVETYGGFGGYIVATGTSMAVPHVVGIASILWERDITCDSHLIRKVIDASARKTDSNKGIGIVDLEYALEIYDDVKKSYELDETIEVPKNRNELKNYDTEGYIEGQWAGSAHTNSIDKGYTMGDMSLKSPIRCVSH